MDWGFSAESFHRVYDFIQRKGLDIDNRFFKSIIENCIKIYKGTCLKAKFSSRMEFFHQYIDFSLYNECVDLLGMIKESKKNKFKVSLDCNMERQILGKQSLSRALMFQKRWIVGVKNQIIYQELSSYCESVLQNGIKWELSQEKRKGKAVFVIPNSSLAYFSSKVIQEQLKQQFKLRVSNRRDVINGLIAILSKGFPKSLIRTDIIEFYESIDRKQIMESIEQSGLIPVNQIDGIKKLLDEYGKLSKQSKGLPRGNGLSACLSEYLLKDFDKRIKTSENVLYYARFVDDIVVVLQEETAGKMENANKAWEEMNLAINKYNLSFHPKGSKSQIVNLSSDCSFDYLGYHFSQFGKSPKRAISENKLEKYKQRISLAFWAFYKDEHSTIAGKSSLLRKRIRYLTGITKLSGMKKGVSVGIKVVYPNINDLDCLDKLDDYLKNQIKKLPLIAQYKIQRLGFRRGFDFSMENQFSSNELKKVLSIWR